MPNEFLEKLRQRDSRFAGIDDSTLAAKIIERRPDLAVHLQGVSGKVQRAGYPIPNIPTQPMPYGDRLMHTLNEGVAFKQRGMNTAARAKALTSLGQAVGIPFEAAREYLASDTSPLNPMLTGAKKVGGVAMDVAGFIPSMIGRGAGAISRGIGGEGETSQAVGETVETLAPWALTPPIIRGGSKAVGAGVKAFRNSRIPKGNVNFNRSFPVNILDAESRATDLANMGKYLAEEQRTNPAVAYGKQGERRGGQKPSVANQLANEKFPEIKQRIFTEGDRFIERNANVPLKNGIEPIALEIESLNNIYTEKINRSKYNSIVEEANKYRQVGNLNLRQASDLRKSLNAELESFHKMVEEGQMSAENAAKPIAEIKKAVDGIRKEISGTLESLGENVNEYNSLQRDYGSAIALESAARRGVPKSVKPRQFIVSPDNTQIGSVHGVTDKILGRTFGEQLNAPDKVAMRALNTFAKSDLKVPTVQAPPFRRLPEFARSATDASRTNISTSPSNLAPKSSYPIPMGPRQYKMLPPRTGGDIIPPQFPPIERGPVPPISLQDRTTVTTDQSLRPQRLLAPPRSGENIPPQSPLPIQMGRPLTSAGYAYESQISDAIKTMGGSNIKFHKPTKGQNFVDFNIPDVRSADGTLTTFSAPLSRVDSPAKLRKIIEEKKSLMKKK